MHEQNIESAPKKQGEQHFGTGLERANNCLDRLKLIRGVQSFGQEGERVNTYLAGG